MQGAVRHTRTVAALLALTLTWNGFAHAARPSHRLALLQAAAQTAQTVPAPPERPLGARERMRLAHTVLLTETGNDPYFALSETDAYNTVLNALNTWGRYRVVTDAAQADLVIQLHGVAVATAVGGTTQDPGGSVVYTSTLHLTVADPHTLSPVWQVSVPVQPAARAKTRARNVAATGEEAVSQLKLVAGDPLSRTEQAQLKQAYKSHTGLIVGLGAAGFALTLGLFFLTRHEAQQNAANFCQQHNLSPCPGA